MGSHCSQVGFVNLGTLWDNVPAGGEVIITRDKITISERPMLDIGSRVLCQDKNPSPYGQILMSLSELQYGEESDQLLSPTEQDHTRRGATGDVGESKRTSRYGSSSTLRSEFHPELNGIYPPTSQSKVLSTIALTESDESEDFHGRHSKTDSLYQLPALNSEEGDGYMPEMSPTTIFTTRSLAENMRDLQNFLQQQQGTPEDGRSIDIKIDENTPTSSQEKCDDMNTEDKVAFRRPKRNSLVLRTEEGVIMAKKLATAHEQKGKRECHVYFTPRTSAEIWPPLVVTVGEDWDFVKVMRKSIANLQRSITKGERDGTHDWLFDYHPNKDIKKIKKELKVLFGRKVVSFRGSHLKKPVKDVSNDFINKMWILQKDEGKHRKAKMRPKEEFKHMKGRRMMRSKSLHAPVRYEKVIAKRSNSYNGKKSSTPNGKKSRQPKSSRFSRLSQRL